MSRQSTKLLMILLCVINMLNYFDRYIIAAILDPIAKELHFTDTQLGRFPFVFLASYMIAAPLCGMFANRLNRTKTLGAAIAFWSLATTGAAFAQNYMQMLLSRSLLGIGEAVFVTLGPAIICDLYPEKARASKFTWFYLAIPVGSAIGFGASGAIAHAYGWRMSFLVAGLPGLISAFFMARIKDPQKGAFDTAATTHRAVGLRDYIELAGKIFQNRVWLSCTACYIAYTFAFGALSHWFPTMVQRRYGVTTGESGLVFGVIAVLTGLTGTFAGGQIASKWQEKIPSIGILSSLITLLFAAPFLFLSMRTETLSVCYATVTLAMFFLFFNTSPINAATVNAVSALQRPIATSLNVFLIHVLGDAISPEIVGRLSEASGSTGQALAAALQITIPATLISAGALFFALKPRAIRVR